LGVKTASEINLQAVLYLFQQSLRWFQEVVSSMFP